MRRTRRRRGIRRCRPRPLRRRQQREQEGEAGARRRPWPFFFFFFLTDFIFCRGEVRDEGVRLKRSMLWPSRQSPPLLLLLLPSSLHPGFYPLVLSVHSLTSTAASAASAALCAAVFLGLAAAATERRAGVGGEPTERRRKCDDATDAADDSGGTLGANGADAGAGAEAAAAAATARRGAQNELLATPPRVAMTAGCCIFDSKERARNKGAILGKEGTKKKNLENTRKQVPSQTKKWRELQSSLCQKKRERKNLSSSHAPLPGLPRGVRGPDRLPPGPAGYLRRQGRAQRKQSLGRRRESVRR